MRTLTQKLVLLTLLKVVAFVAIYQIVLAPGAHLKTDPAAHIFGLPN
jgi:hypothetical protein